MTSFLFPATTASQGLRLRNNYGLVYTDIVRASSDAVDALSLYRDLLFSQNPDVDSVGFAAFDAHVGDTSCQVRAAMLLDLTRHHRKMASESSRATWLDEYIERLTAVRDKARETLADLTIKRIHPAKLGIGATEDTPAGILSNLGWSEPDLDRRDNALYQRSAHPLTNAYKLEPADEHEKDLPFSLRTPDSDRQGARTPTSDSEGTAFERLTESSFPSEISDVDSAPSSRVSDAGSQTPLSVHPPSDTCSQTPLSVHFAEALHILDSDEVSTSSCKRGGYKEQANATSPKSYMSPLLEGPDPAAAWDALDAKMAVRFLVFCFTLSKYKTFGRFAGGVGGRLYPEEAIRIGDAMVADVWNRATPDYKYSKATRRVILEFGALQTWISELSCAWLCHTAKYSAASPSLGSLMVDTFKTSSKSVSCVSTYVGWLAIRELWARDGYSLIFVDRYFCYHSNFFLATFHLESTDAGAESGVPEHCRPLRQQVSWTMERVDQDWLLSEQGQGRPYVIVTGNSINGGYEDYMRVAHTSERHSEGDSSCADNDAHVAEFLAHDPDRLALSFFGHHRHYTFDSSGKEKQNDETVAVDNERVAGCMDRAFPGLAACWTASHGEADEVGTAGASLRMFAWQHCFAETKGRIARLVYEANNTLPISAPLSRLGTMSG
ncbi:hypothetical protein BBO_09182 [Beauveria brongniartii RCEF 3172]|uniref:Uncharacterized protein n=1 Tax=Beauveria brongniartii RCEF 3172 TaxID=1081107 RepID=A0A166WAU8_9HYPO|nr:hypothetical protein BBO_09182 [Beauveria brongniartii RCEF 3172]